MSLNFDDDNDDYDDIKEHEKENETSLSMITR